MSYADPQSLTINSVANSLPRISSGPNSGTFSKDDGTVKLTVSHQYGKRTRRQVRVDFRKVAADPLATGYNKEYSMSTYFVIDHPPVGFTNTEAKQIVDALTAYLAASTGANVTKLLGGEN